MNIMILIRTAKILMKFLALDNETVADVVVLDKTPKNATYISPKIQKEILHSFSEKVHNAIREEIDYKKSCIIVNEARD